MPSIKIVLVNWLLAFLLVFAVVASLEQHPVAAAVNTPKLTWTKMDTPSSANNILVPSEVNFIAIGSDDKIFYAVDCATIDPGPPATQGRIYKSTDGGITWITDLKAALLAAGAVFPVWNIAIAPDDPNFVAVVTTDAVQPRKVYISTDAGVTWNDSLLPAGINNISSIDISAIYGTDSRDIAVGTRAGGVGQVYTRKATGLSSWVAQAVPPMGGDIIAQKFSPGYASDAGIVIVTANGTGTFLNSGRHDSSANTTAWGVPVELTTGGAGSSAKWNQIVSACISLPSDFSRDDPTTRRFYISYDDIGLSPSYAGVYRVDDTVPYRIFTLSATDRIYSIAYYGVFGSGVLLAGNATTDPSTGIVTVWRTANAESTAVTWSKSTRSPTGGGNNTLPLETFGRANARVAWSPDGKRAYCGTSSAKLDNLPALTPNWPAGYLVGKERDESAFSVSPYSADYELLLELNARTKDLDVGNNWNQLSLIDTAITNLSDVAALGVPEGSTDYPVLYMASVNSGLPLPLQNTGFDSVWRSTSDPLGRKWERIMCFAASGSTPNNILLRVNLRPPKVSETRSRVLVVADQFVNNIRFSSDEGQNWNTIYAGVNVTDCTLSSDTTMYVLDNIFVRKGNYINNNWQWDSKITTSLDTGHTIYALPEPVQTTTTTQAIEKWVIVSEAGGQSRVAYCDFGKTPAKFERINVPIPLAGNVHAILDEGFRGNKFIYAAVNDLSGTAGKIYRWILGSSTTWEDMQPPNTAFYGLVQRSGALYGAWKVPVVPPPVTGGVDRTLYPMLSPIPLEWDDLTFGLPAAGVLFTREPSSLKVSSNGNVDLWAVDFNPYIFTNNQGCLWRYTDTLAKNGPWTTSPPSGAFLPVDPVTGRANEINFRWRDLPDALVYELWLAKDDKFTQLLLTAPSIVAADPLDPAMILFPGPPNPLDPAWILHFPLEANHQYFWKTRVVGGATGEIIHSPWSATMYFTIQAGLPVNAYYMQPQLLNPKNAYGCACDAPVPFSWTTLKDIKKYSFELSESADMSNPLVSKAVDVPAYLYDGTFKCGKSYFWRVRAVEPFPSDWSGVFSFTMKPGAASAEITGTVDDTPAWFWVVAVILALILAMIIIVIVVIVVKKSRRIV